MSLSGLEQRLTSEIVARRGALLEDLRLEVQTPTGPGHTAGLDETRGRLTGRLAALGATVELVPGDPRPDWLYGEAGGGGGGGAIPVTAVCRRLRPGAPAILISGHLDTVHDPAGPFRALSVSADGATATGPGCVDMKGGLVIAMAALEALDAVGAGVSWSVVLNSDEETGSYHSESVLRREAARAEYGLALEPALPGGGLAVSRMGSGQFMIECRGRAAHVGRDFERGVSAVTRLAECLVAVGRMAEPGAGRVLSVGPIEGGRVTNAVPDLARAWGNVRFIDAPAAGEIGASLDALATGPGAMPSVLVRRSFNRPAKPRTPGALALAERARGVAEALGQGMTFAHTGGVCDGNILQDAGLATIDTLGVRGGGLHTDQEWIELASLVERCQLLAVLILRLSGLEGVEGVGGLGGLGGG